MADEKIKEIQFGLSETQRITFVGSWFSDMEGNIRWSREALRIYGLSTENGGHTIESIIKCIHPDDQTKLQNWITSCRAGENPGEITYRAILPDGTIRFLTGNGELKVDAQNKPLYMIGTIQDTTEGMKVEEQISKANERFELVGKATGDAVWDWNIIEDETRGNATLYKFYGLDPEKNKLNSSIFFEHVHPDDVSRVKEALGKALNQTAEFLTEEFRFRKFDGTYRTVIDKGYISYDKSGKPIRVVGVMQDITEKVQSHNALKESEERYRQIVETTHEGIWAIDHEGYTTFVNERMAAMLGVARKEMLGKHFFEFMDEEGKVIATRNMQRREQGISEDHEFRFITKDGSELWALLKTSPFEKLGKYAGALAMATDITGRKKAEKSLLDSEQRYKNLLNNINDGFIVDDISGKIIFANKKFLEIFDFTEDDISQLFLEDYVAPEYHGMLRDRHNRRMAGEKVNDVFEFEGLRKDGRKIWIEARVNPIIENGIITGTQSILHDITERKTAEEEIKAERQFLHTLIDNIPDLIYTKNIAGGKTMANKGDMLFMGVQSEEEFMGKTDLELFPNAGGLRAHKNDMDVIRSGIPVINVEEEFIDTEAHQHWLLTSKFPLYNAEGKITGLLGIGRNITDLKKAEEEKYLLQDSLQKSLNEIYIVDPDTLLFQYMNSGAMKNIGYSETEIKKLTPLDLEPAFTKQTFNELIAPLVNGEEEKIVFFTDHKRKDGSLYPVEAHLQFVRQKNKNVFLAVILDITERKKISEELAEQRLKQQKLLTEATIQAQEMERNGLGRELHDNINQILSVIKMYLGMARTGDGIQEVLIDKSYAYVNEAIGEIRKLSHSLVAPTLGDIGLKEALEELTRDTNYLKNLQVKFDIDESYNENGMDENKKLMFYRIVQEQLNNIIKYAAATKVVLTMKVDSDQLHLSVADNGVGFDTSRKAYGIGFKNINSRIEFYSGHMNVISAPGCGCTLEVTIPY